MFDVIVVGTDGSETAEVAVNEAIALAGTHGSALHVVSSYKPNRTRHVSGGGEGWDIRPEDEVDALLEAAAARARGRDVQVRTHSSRREPAKAVLAVAKEVGADLIVVGNRGMRGTKRFLLGSVPNSIAHGAQCHVLVLKTS
ncbi:universal stress protein [Paraconexibacter sp.]|uniref:universal stress protein n=1 Tax=Paraconexibacter sp. TaxID=2949640 RepID=UPI00356691AC